MKVLAVLFCNYYRYDKLLHKAHRHSYLKSIINGTVFAIYNLVLFLIFSIGFWYVYHVLLKNVNNNFILQLGMEENCSLVVV